MNDIREQLFVLFQTEHAEHLQQIHSMLALAENVEGGPGEELLDEAFRRAHSLKGAARAVDLRPVEGLAHRLETLFSQVRDGKLRLDRQVGGVIRQVLDASADCMASWETDRTAPEPVGALRAIEAILGVSSDMSPAAPSPSLPRPSAALQPVETVRVTGADLDRVMRSTAQILMEAQRQNTLTEEVREVSDQVRELAKEWDRFRKASTALARLSAQPKAPVLDRSIAVLDHRVRSLAMHSRTTYRSLQNNVWRMRHCGRELQRDVWRARLVPAESLVEGFRKMVRDLARDEKKEIDFRVIGAEAQADRMVLQRLKDPLMHLLRNAISHGLETPRERASNGKVVTGTLVLRLESQRRRLIATVEDDGRGLDLKRVADVAIERGLLSSAEAAASAPHDIARLIFQPGFSTSRAVTDLSGRGMGLSVVYESVRRLQGEVEVTRMEGPGTSIVLSVPVSISACHLVLVSCENQTFGIPSHAITCLSRFQTKHLESIQGKPAVTLNGQRYPLCSLARLLRMHDAPAAVERDTLAVMLLRAGVRSAAVLVDAFVSGCDALIQDLGVGAASAGNVTGGVLLEDGSVALVLNPVSLVEASLQSGALGLDSRQPALKKIPGTILVVDDSITTRSLEKGILEACGYRVRVAVDGVEALELLRAETADLVITDIQMPRMDGFGLVAAMKADRGLHKIPVIVVSSLDSPNDQARGLTLGADVYIAKGKFDQGELLEAIQQLI